MQIMIQNSRLEIVRGDIVIQDVDAIVNAANQQLAAGSGVCGAIHQAAGYDQMVAACRAIGGCPTGEARITPGFNLPARYVIHAVGPIYDKYRPDRNAELLASAYRSSLALATQEGLHSVAFPSISTGVYGYPVEEAAPVALKAVADFLRDYQSINMVRFVLWDAPTQAAYERVVQGWM